jgi:hypothetical protein
MTISDRQTISQVLAEQNASLLRNDKKAIIAIGAITNAEFLLTGSLEKMDASNYGLQLSVVKAETATVQANFYKVITIADLRSMQPLREASIDLLKQMKIDLTAEGEAAIRNVSTSEAQGAIALAQGIAAADDNAVERLIYLTNAVAFDSRQLEAIDLLATTEENIANVGTGAAISTDVERRKQFLAMMEQFEKHYETHPPFELVLVPKTEPYGETDYVAEEAQVQFAISMRASVEFETMQKVLKIILDDLKKTGKKELWGFTYWPKSAELFRNPKEYIIKAELLNDDGKRIDEVEIPMTARLVFVSNKIYASSPQNLHIPFKKMPISIMTNEPQVRITHVNSMTAQESLQNDFVRISSELELPKKQSQNKLMLWADNNLSPAKYNLIKQEQNDLNAQ